MITGADGAAWQNAAKVAADKLDIHIIQAAIGAGAPYADADGRWQCVREISEQGALLVRPDNHVGWRSRGAARDAQAELEGAICALLKR